MGWVGVATLIATSCYLLYRFPPSTWSPEPAPLNPQERPAKPTPEESLVPRATQDATIDSKPRPPAEDEGHTEESQSTPKASASNAPVLEIPTLHLGSDLASETPSDKRPFQNGSARSPAPPSAASKSNPPPILTTKTVAPPPTPTLMPPPPPPQQSASGGSSSLMPPPSGPRPRPTKSQPQQQQQSSSASLLSPPQRYPQRLNTSGNSPMRPPPSSAATARGAARPGTSLAPAQLNVKPLNKSSQRAVLEPGFSPLDWAALTSNPNNKLRGANLPPHLIRVTPSMLKAQNGRKGTDAWTSYQGKVYNISPYLPFHPGGKGELLRGAGKDSGKLFFEIHPWVNWDAIMGECLVGILVSEHEAAEEQENKLDAMD